MLSDEKQARDAGKRNQMHEREEAVGVSIVQRSSRFMASDDAYNRVHGSRVQNMSSNLLRPQADALLPTSADAPRREWQRRIDSLGDSERFVLQMILIGMRDREISLQQGVSAGAIAARRRRLMKRLGAIKAVSSPHFAVKTFDRSPGTAPANAGR